MNRVLAGLAVGGLFLLPLAVFADHNEWHTHIVNGAKAYDQGKYDEANKEFHLALKEADSFGDKDPRRAISLNQLGLVALEQEKYKEAQDYFDNALAIREKALGKEHPDTAQTLDNLAAVYDAQGNSKDAEAAARRSLQIKEKVLGGNSPELATTLDNLAGICETEGKCEYE